jgi:hypothetical protein
MDTNYTGMPVHANVLETEKETDLLISRGEGPLFLSFPALVRTVPNSGR